MDFETVESFGRATRRSIYLSLRFLLFLQLHEFCNSFIYDFDFALNHRRLLFARLHAQLQRGQLEVDPSQRLSDLHLDVEVEADVDEHALRRRTATHGEAKERAGRARAGDVSWLGCRAKEGAEMAPRRGRTIASACACSCVCACARPHTTACIQNSLPMLICVFMGARGAPPLDSISVACCDCRDSRA